ncbi:MAG: hypothetical protein ABIB72_00440 [Candidatus Falkowbacteria bacterium]
MLSYKNFKLQNGVALLITILIMSLILSLGVYVLNFSLTETKIAVSQVSGGKTYYLAEAGIHEMVWKLKNDTTYKNNFETDPAWTASFTRLDPFGSGSGSYTVAITNTSIAHGDIISTGSININGKTSQRIIKTYVYRALGQSGIGGSSSYTDGNIDISSSNVNYIGGNAHSNGVFNINGSSNVNIEGNLDAVGNYNENQLATVTIGGTIHAHNYPPEAEEIIMPAVDFDSNDASSMKNKANATYTPTQFENLIKNNSSLTLDGIIYVSGKTNIKDDIDLTINGLLVVNGDLNIISDNHEVINLTVNSATSTPSGIMANGKMQFQSDLGNIYINGVLYSTEQLTIGSVYTGQNFTINGGTASRKLTITSSSRIINIVFNNQILVDTLSPTSFSPVLTVDHWEEEY